MYHKNTYRKHVKEYNINNPMLNIGQCPLRAVFRICLFSPLTNQGGQKLSYSIQSNVMFSKLKINVSLIALSAFSSSFIPHFLSTNWLESLWLMLTSLVEWLFLVTHELLMDKPDNLAVLTLLIYSVSVSCPLQQYWNSNTFHIFASV